MAKVEIYTKGYCPYCHRAKALLDRLGVDYKEIDVEHDPKLQAYMTQLTGGRTVPQILINDQAIGGSDDLHALHANGQLQKLLQP